MNPHPRLQENDADYQRFYFRQNHPLQGLSIKTGSKNRLFKYNERRMDCSILAVVRKERWR
jgi:hypothetical protein